MRQQREAARRRTGWAVALTLLVISCGPSTRGPRYASRGQLVCLLFPPFPEPLEPGRSPPAAGLVQQIVLRFDAAPDPRGVQRSSLPIRRRDNGQLVRGTYDVRGKDVTFTPALPTRAPGLSDLPTGDGAAALEPGTWYECLIGPTRWDFVELAEAWRLAYPDAVDPVGARVAFRTTDDPDRYFRGYPPQSPRLLAVDPPDGAVDVTPHLHTDPRRAFPQPARPPLRLHFDAPLRPDLTNVGPATFLLRDLDDDDLLLACEVSIVTNSRGGSEVWLQPSGILPFGHLLVIEYPAALRGLGQLGLPDGQRRVATAFTTARPRSAGAVVDWLIEDFDEATREETRPDQLRAAGPDGQPARPPGSRAARWVRGVLQPALPALAEASLGDFKPPPPVTPAIRQLVLDTNGTDLPLLDGSTPEAPFGTHIADGVFTFDDILIPAGVEVHPRGDHPLILQATGSIILDGAIVADGRPGAGEYAFDSGVTSLPGGAAVAAGGRGGEGHPVLHFPPTQPIPGNLVSPPTGGPGFGPGNRARTGGKGGDSGALDHPDASGRLQTNAEIQCRETCPGQDPWCHHNGYRVGGGGGGSLLQQGEAAHARGPGNVRADGTGSFLLSVGGGLRAGPPGPSLFRDALVDNNFVGPGGEYQNPLGGQGGGGGGSALDSYYCGRWCWLDARTSNDGVCQDEFSGQFADSVGDARGGAGGGGGGVIILRALGEVIVRGRISCRGGRGGGGEAIGCSNWSGAGGGGSGGMILIESARAIVIGPAARLDVRGGDWVLASPQGRYVTTCRPNRAVSSAGSISSDGGAGGHGLIQLRVPPGMQAQVASALSITPAAAWLDAQNLANPAALAGRSVAVSRWYDLGRTVDRGSGTAPAFRFLRHGRAASPGDLPVILTHGDGLVRAPERTDATVDGLPWLLPGQDAGWGPVAPRADFIPPGAQVEVEFQGAQAISPGSREVDPDSLTDWDAGPQVAEGHQFVRFRINFSIPDGANSAQPRDLVPTVQRVLIRARF